MSANLILLLSINSSTCPQIVDSVIFLSLAIIGTFLPSSKSRLVISWVLSFWMRSWAFPMGISSAFGTLPPDATAKRSCIVANSSSSIASKASSADSLSPRKAKSCRTTNGSTDKALGFMPVSFRPASERTRERAT